MFFPWTTIFLDSNAQRSTVILCKKQDHLNKAGQFDRGCNDNEGYRENFASLPPFIEDW